MTQLFLSTYLYKICRLNWITLLTIFECPFNATQTWFKYQTALQQNIWSVKCESKNIHISNGKLNSECIRWNSVIRQLIGLLDSSRFYHELLDTDRMCLTLNWPIESKWELYPDITVLISVFSFLVDKPHSFSLGDAFKIIGIILDWWRSDENTRPRDDIQWSNFMPQIMFNSIIIMIGWWLHGNPTVKSIFVFISVRNCAASAGLKLYATKIA